MPKTPDENSRAAAPKPVPKPTLKTQPKAFDPKREKGKAGPKPPKQRIIRHQGR